MIELEDGRIATLYRKIDISGVSKVHYMTATILHRHQDTTTNKNEPSHVVINDEILTDYAINEIKEARKEIKRGEFYTEKEIMAKFGLE